MENVCKIYGNYIKYINFVLLVFSLALFSGCVVRNNGFEDEMVVKEIESEVVSYDNENSVLPFKEIALDPDAAKASEGGSITLFNDVSGTMMVDLELFGAIGNNKITYYIKNSKIIFIRSISNMYDLPITMENSQIVSSTTEKFYFFNDSLIKYYDGQKDVDVTESEAVENSAMLLNLYNDVVNKFLHE